jgi:hypothetical protein
MGKAAAISGGNTGRNDLPQQCERRRKMASEETKLSVLYLQCSQ